MLFECISVTLLQLSLGMAVKYFFLFQYYLDRDRNLFESFSTSRAISLKHTVFERSRVSVKKLESL